MHIDWTQAAMVVYFVACILIGIYLTLYAQEDIYDMEFSSMYDGNIPYLGLIFPVVFETIMLGREEYHNKVLFAIIVLIQNILLLPYTILYIVYLLLRFVVLVIIDLFNFIFHRNRED